MCDFCSKGEYNEPIRVKDEDGVYRIRIDEMGDLETVHFCNDNDGMKHTTLKEFHIKYCPICGRKL